jgi:hypothetical protein
MQSQMPEVCFIGFAPPSARVRTWTDFENSSGEANRITRVVRSQKDRGWRSSTQRPSLPDPRALAYHREPEPNRHSASLCCVHRCPIMGAIVEMSESGDDIYS